MKFSCKKKTNQNIRKQGDIETSKLSSLACTIGHLTARKELIIQRGRGGDHLLEWLVDTNAIYTSTICEMWNVQIMAHGNCDALVCPDPNVIQFN
jgi:hypothetical protein